MYYRRSVWKEIIFFFLQRLYRLEKELSEYLLAKQFWLF